MLSLHQVVMDGIEWRTVIETTDRGRRAVNHMVMLEIRGPYKPGEVRMHVACESRQAINVFPGSPPVCVRCCELAIQARDDGQSKVYG